MEGLNKAAEMDPSLPMLLFFAPVAFILLFIIARILRGIAGARVRKIREFGMDFDVVAHMSKKGLLTPDEANRVKAVITRHFSRLHDQLPGSGPAATAASSIKALEIGLQQRQVGPAASEATPPPAGATQRQANGLSPDPGIVSLPTDVREMHQMGMITDEELEALNRFYAARAKEQAMEGS